MGTGQSELWRRPGVRFRVFSATKAREREVLGEKVTRWLRENKLEGIHHEVNQSSDNEFHCLSICVWAVLPARLPAHRRERGGVP